jgi:hypothetical protein
MFLAYDFVERPGAQPVGKRGGRRAVFGGIGNEKVSHDGTLDQFRRRSICRISIEGLTETHKDIS